MASVRQKKKGIRAASTTYTPQAASLPRPPASTNAPLENTSPVRSPSSGPPKAPAKAAVVSARNKGKRSPSGAAASATVRGSPNSSSPTHGGAAAGARWVGGTSGQASCSPRLALWRGLGCFGVVLVFALVWFCVGCC